MAKLERLMNLTAALLETQRPLTAAELKDRVPGYPEAKASFRRTFERDKDELRQLGLPLTTSRVESEDGAIEGYRIPRAEYEFVEVGLEPDELTSLAMAARSLQLAGDAGAAGVWKLGGAANADAEALAVSDVVTDPRLGTIFAAIADRMSVEFDYRGRRRVIDPHRLDFRRGRWYLTGHDHGHGEVRAFRTDRIESDEVTRGEPIQVASTGDKGLILEPWQLGDAEPIEVRLALDPSVSEWVLRNVTGLEPDGEDAQRRPVVRCMVRDVRSFCSFVGGLLTDVEILSPDSLRAEMLEWLDGVREAAR